MYRVDLLSPRVDFREFGELQCFLERACTKAGHISAAATRWTERAGLGRVMRTLTLVSAAFNPVPSLIE